MALNLPSQIRKPARIAAAAGALNWGLIGIGVGNVLEMLLGSIPMALTIVYVLAGLGGLVSLIAMLGR